MHGFCDWFISGALNFFYLSGCRKLQPNTAHRSGVYLYKNNDGIVRVEGSYCFFYACLNRVHACAVQTWPAGG